MDNKVVARKAKVITCKAAVARAPGQPLSIEEVQVDPPRWTEVRVRIHFTSICHTDLSAWKGENEAQRAYPRILGHEASGVIESIGGGVTDLEEGDHVVPIFHGECGDCDYCRRPDTNMCPKFGANPMKKTMTSDGKVRFWSKDRTEPIYHFLNTSTFSEYTVIDSSCVVKIDPNFPLKKMSLLSCGVSTGVGAVWITADVQAGEKVAIFGLGAVGLAAAAGAKARGASQIIGVDVNPEKFIKGKVAGITDFINPKELLTPVHKVIQKLTGGGGVDYSFECSGDLLALREAFLSTQMGWGLTLLLGVHTKPDTLPIHPMELFNGQRLVGCVFGGFKGKTQLSDFAAQCVQGAVDLDQFVTHELPFERINEALQLLKDGKSLRCVLSL
ncbi:hypothetical protein SAY87_011206 [Trapa incisa]|uniref:alcohol dehydrogenase n=1 Tax=Trapa incisa TaxID=236973 RepID=A0AAN7JI57_9MYRT|nr:hypothetical protein SAY87_011206 [Trapa incisa]